MAGIPKCDWEEVEKRFRTNQGSNVEIGRDHNVSEAAIRKRAKKEGWTKDLAEDFQRELRNKQLKQLGSKHGARLEPAKSKEERDSDRSTIDDAVEATLEIVSKQTARIDRLNESLESMLDEFDKGDMLGYTKDGEPFTDYRAKADYMRTMTTSLEKLIKLERVAHGIEDNENPFKKPLESLARKEDLKSMSKDELMELRASIKARQ